MNFYNEAANFIKAMESFSSKAYWDVNAWRIGYGSDTITLPDGTFKKVIKTDTITRELAALDLQRRIKKEFEPTIIKQIGKNYSKIKSNAKIALISLAYNYGSITHPEIIKAARLGDSNEIGKAIFDSTINDNKNNPFYQVNRIRRKKEWNKAIEPDQDLTNISSGSIKPNNLFFFGIIAAGAIYFMLQQNK